MNHFADAGKTNPIKPNLLNAHRVGGLNMMETLSLTIPIIILYLVIGNEGPHRCS